MLTIAVNNKTLSLSSDISIRISWVNPACFMDLIPGDAGLGIEIPVNEINRAILGNPERFEKYAIGQDRKFPSTEIRYSGVLLLQGSLNITNATDQHYSAWLQSEVGILGEAQREKLITDLPWKTDQEFVNKGYAPGYDDDHDDYGIRTIRNRGFWDGKGKEASAPMPYLDQNGIPRYTEETGSAMMARHYENFHYMINHFQDLYEVVTTGDACVVSPYLHLRYVIGEVLRMNEWFIDRNDMLTRATYFTFWKNLMVYNNFNIIGMDWETITQPRLEWDEDARMYVEVGVESVTFVNWGLRTFNYADLIPPIKMKDFLIGIQNTLNMVFHFSRYKKVHIIDRNEIITETPIDLDKYKVGFWEIGERKQVTLKFLPDYDKEDTLLGSNFHDLTERRHDFKDPVNTYDDLLAINDAEFGELRLVKNLNKIYEWKFHVHTGEDHNRVEDQIDMLGWEFVSSGPQPFMYGDYEEIEEIKTPLSTLQKNPVLGFYEAMQKGNLAKMRSLWSDFTFRVIDYAAADIMFPGGLNWEGDFGLFENRWKKWAGFWAHRLPVSGEFDLPLNVLMLVADNITKPYRENKGAFLIEEMDVEFGLYTIGTARIKGFKL